jgi:predicted DNA-binding transcriptional regulator YafY
MNTAQIPENPDLGVVLTVKEAAAACGVSLKTIRRRLDKDLFPNAVRGPGVREGLEGPWLIPTADLLASGLSFSAPKPAQPLPVSAATTEAPASTDSAELEKLKADNAALATELENAKTDAAHARELLKRADEAMALIQKALTAGPSVSEPRERRGWFRR